VSIKDEKRTKARGLIEIALDKGATSEERNSSAMLAIKVIRKYKMLDPTPLDGILEHDTVRAVKTVADKLTDPEFTGGLKTLFKEVTAVAASSSRRRRRR
jgi:hypothetical protein